MFNLAPWYYRDFLLENSFSIFETISTYRSKLVTGEEKWEAVSKLKSDYLPSWIKASSIYSQNEGSGTSDYKNIAIHKAISEGLERWAFYATVDDSQNEYCFEINPSTTGMAAYPERFTNNARRNAIFEATERWALHEFWRSKLPIKEHRTDISHFRHFEIITGLKGVSVSLLHFQMGERSIFGFACGKDLQDSFQHAVIELSRNISVLSKLKNDISLKSFTEVYDRRMYFFSTSEGLNLFNDTICSSPDSVSIKPKLICDKEVKGPWSKYAKVWRYLYADTDADDSDYTFFMF